MTSRDFAYWLQGWFEINGEVKAATKEQMEMIQAHLNMVFIHDIDPKMGDKEHQKKLNQAHSGIGFQKFEEVKPKKQLHELIPDHTVTYSDVPLSPKPDDWEPHWEHDSLHGWYDPKFGVPRC